MRQQGQLADWKDDRGFGFISPAAGGPRVFAHISAFPRGTRPVTGDLVTYAESQDERRRPRATDVQFVRTARSRRGHSRGLAPALATATAFVVLLVLLTATDRAPAVLVVVYLGLSALALLLYRSDKSAAERGAWRVPEFSLHLVSLLGGWPGALVARQAFRHKTRKQPFRTIFWGTVLVNCGALAWLVTGTPAWLG